MAIDKKLYRADQFRGKTAEEVADYVQEELGKIEEAFYSCLQNPLFERHEAPLKVFTGLTVLADGTDWNPGSGQGVYTYYAAAWRKLG